MEDSQDTVALQWSPVLETGNTCCPPYGPDPD